MQKQGTLVVVDDNRAILTSLQYLLADYFSRIVTLTGPTSLVSTLQAEKPDLLLLDMNFSAGINSGGEGLYWLREVKRSWPDLPVVLFTAYADIDLAVEAVKEGATDFITKPWENAKLIAKLTDACRKGRESSRRKRRNDPSPTPQEAMVWGASQAMQQLRQLVERISPTDANVLITGDNGTGKDMLAREIHRLSGRAAGPYVAVDMGSISETLFESELFGHVKGAFTDAHADRTGRFEAAHGGTLFLDEIANLPLHLQVKLLTALQQRSVVRVGSTQHQPVDIRLICATNSPIEQLVREGQFRQDLYFRINTLPLHLPPLRERREDILPLARHFLGRYATQYGRPHQAEEGFTPAAEQCLLAHTWPGNIRELQHTIEKAVILSEDGAIPPESLQFSADTTPSTPAPTPAADSPVVTLEEMERQLVEQAISQAQGNLSQAASLLGISRQTLYNKMKRYGL